MMLEIFGIIMIIFFIMALVSIGVLCYQLCGFNKSNIDFKFFGIVLIILLVLTIIVSFTMYFYENKQIDIGLDKVCEEFGYKQMTQKQETTSPAFDSKRSFKRSFKIECDNNYYIKNIILERKEQCNEYDEWGDCISKEKIYKHKNGSGVLFNIWGECIYKNPWKCENTKLEEIE